AVALAEGTFGGNSYILDAWLTWRGLDAVDQLRTLIGKLLCRKEQARVKHHEEKAIILHLAPRQRGPGEETHGLNRQGQAIAFMTPKRQDTAEQDIPGIGGWIAVFVDACAGWQGLIELGVQEHFTPHER